MGEGVKFSAVAPTVCGFLTYYPRVEDLWLTTEVEGFYPGDKPVQVHSRFDGYYTPAGKVYDWDPGWQEENRLTDGELAAEYQQALGNGEVYIAGRLLALAKGEDYWEEIDRERKAGWGRLVLTYNAKG